MIKQIAREIVEREGGFVNDPNDLGGATNWGVTQKTLRKVRGAASIQDVKNLTQDEAVEIYLEYYFYKRKINKLPEPLQETVFDMQVNSGINAIKILQKISNKFGLKLKVDGYLGPKSIKAINDLHTKAQNHLVDAYGIGRRDYYFEIADKRPQNRKYCVTRRGKKGGWIKRAEEFISSQYDMTKDEFNKRIAKWA